MFYFLIALTWSSFIFGEVQFKLKKSSIRYEVKNFLKTVHGTSTGAKGVVKCDDKSCNFLIAAPLISFDSENSNRDAHMQQVMKAGSFPLVEARGEFKTNIQGEVTLPILIQFAGEKHTYFAKITIQNQSKNLIVDGTMAILLTDFHIDRPSLLTRPIEDEVPIQVHLQFQK